LFSNTIKKAANILVSATLYRLKQNFGTVGISSFVENLTGLGRVSVILVSVLMASSAAGSASERYQSLESIAQVVRQTVSAMPAVTLLKNPSIEVLRLNNRLRVVECPEPLTAVQPATGLRGGRISIRVSCKGPRPWSVYVMVSLKSEVQVVITTRAMTRGDVLSREDINEKTVLRAPAHQPLVRQAEEALGNALKRSIGEGVELSAAMLKKPTIIRSGEHTLIMAEGGGLQVRVTGKALQHGVAGEIIRVLNLSSKKTVRGKVEADGTITVSRW
tara:strand:+ start:2198 stop:3022 length:825 start_codon:yes stop_codon:yes gene_type:complete